LNSLRLSRLEHKLAKQVGRVMLLLHFLLSSSYASSPWVLINYEGFMIPHGNLINPKGQQYFHLHQQPMKATHHLF